MSTAPALLAAVEPELEADVAGDLVLNARELSFVDSTGISALIRISGRLDGGSLTLEAPGRNVAKVLRLVRADAFPNVTVLWGE